MNPCLAYFLTFSTYASHLPGTEDGSVDRQNNRYGTPLLPGDRSKVVHAFRRQREPAFEMREPERAMALDAILEVCRFRLWEPFAVHVRATHIHAVVHALDKPERLLRDFKAYATRRFHQVKTHASRECFWSRHGSTRYLWKLKDVELAIHYVVQEQGRVMALFKAPDEGVAMGRVFERVSGLSAAPGQSARLRSRL